MNDKAVTPKIFSDLKTLFDPENIALIGASATFGKWGQVILANIVAGGFKGKVFPVNPKGGKMYGLPVFQKVTDIPDAVDLAFITTPAEDGSGTAGGAGEKAGERGRDYHLRVQRDR